MNVVPLVIRAGGVIGAAALAEAIGLNPGEVRKWAEENGVPMIARTYAFDVPHAQALVAELVTDEADSESEEETDDDDALPFGSQACPEEDEDDSSGEADD